MHSDQLEVPDTVVRRLVGEQFPPWGQLPIRRVSATGTVNAIFRIGDGLAARFPLRDQDPGEVLAALTAEAAAMRELSAAATVPVPEPVATGRPGAGYPLPWSVQTWLPGRDADVEDPAGAPAFAADLARFIAAMRSAGTRGRRFDGQGRGGHLPDDDDWMDTCFLRSERLLDVAPLRAMWAELRTLPAVDADVMSHRDLTPPNVLVSHGRLAGVLDTGAFGPADPALDLVAGWHLLDEHQRGLLRTSLGCGDIQWRRGMAWALQQSMGLVWYYAESNPAMARWGRRTLDRLLGAWPG